MFELAHFHIGVKVVLNDVTIDSGRSNICGRGVVQGGQECPGGVLHCSFHTEHEKGADEIGNRREEKTRVLI